MVWLLFFLHCRATDHGAVRVGGAIPLRVASIARSAPPMLGGVHSNRMHPRGRDLAAARQVSGASSQFLIGWRAEREIRSRQSRGC